MTITQPTPDHIRAARQAAHLTQTQAGVLVHVPLRTWQQWEAPTDRPSHRQMPMAAWELFLIKTGQTK